MRKLTIAALAALALAGCTKTEAPRAPVTSAATTATATAPNFGMDLMLLGSSADVLSASANILVLGGEGYSAAQFAADTEKARAEGERRFDKMLAASAGNAQLQQTVKATAAAYLAFLEQVRPRDGEPVALWQKRASDARSDLDKAAAAVKAELIAAK